ncbi:helix-turn-helix domain-containing protein [Gottschalkiaceae bacterium SANA]|nr:helix-turn-helix domain-containing protein [Gottschalkiaceae bacterium SANA]
MKKNRSIQDLELYIEQFSLQQVLLPDLRKRIEIHQFESNELICLQDTPVHFLYFLVDGELDISSGNEDGATITITQISPLASIGAMEYFSQVTYCQTVISHTESYLIAIPIEIVQEYLSKNLAFHQLLCKHLSERKIDSSKKYAQTLLYPAKARLLIVLSKLADENGLVSAYKSQDLADSLSISTRHLRRLLSQCESENLLKRHGRGLVLNRKSIKRTQVLL